MIHGVRLSMAAPMLLIGYAECVLFAAAGSSDDADTVEFDDDKSLTVSSTIKSCLVGVGPFFPCVNERAMAALERIETMDSVHLDSGLEISRQPGVEPFKTRGLFSFGDNPYNVGAILEAASCLLSRRTFFWDLSRLYPGLQMRIGPTYGGRGMIDFFVDSNRKYDERSFNYGHLLFKRSFLPNVLATQISIASVIPLIFTALFFLTKKAFLLSKFALIITSVVSYGSLILYHGTKPYDHLFDGYHPINSQRPIRGHRPISGHNPIGEHHNTFVGDIRGDKFYSNFNDGYQQISSSQPSSLFRGVNFFSREDQTTYEDPKVERNKNTSNK